MSDATPREREHARMPAWAGKAIERVIASHYDLRSIEGTVAAANHAQELSARWNARGLKVHSSIATGAEVGLELVSYGRAADLLAAAPAAPVQGACRSDQAIGVSGECLRRLEAARGSLVEWWENRPEGIEHGYDVSASPAGSGPLVFDLAVSGATVAIDPSGADARLIADGRPPLRYAGLKAWDATHRHLSARMEPIPGGLRLVVLDAGAIYPVTVDPVLSTNPTTTVSLPGTDLGTSVAVGDVAGDAGLDVIVGAPEYFNSVTSRGRVFVFTGLGPPVSVNVMSPMAGGKFGAAVAVGDIDCSGRDDLVVGSPENDSEGPDAGAVFGYLSPALTTSAPWQLNGDDGYRFGTAIATGNVDGDPCADVIVGAPDFGSGDGRVFVTRGGSTGFQLPTAQLPGGAGSRFGTAVATGLFDGDAFADILVGAPTPGATGTSHIFPGSAFPLSSTPIWSATGSSLGEHGAAVSFGDFDADGDLDVVVGAPGHDAAGGRVSFYLNTSGTLATSAAWHLAGTPTSRFGAALAAAGDLDGDGFPDLVVGAPDHDTSAPLADAGRVAAYRGAVSWNTTAPSEAWSDEGTAASEYLGASVAGTGSGTLNGESPALADVVVGAPGSSEVFVYSGECSLVTYFLDDDGDGYGDPSVTTQACTVPPAASPPVGYVDNDDDCDDGDELTNPGAIEVPGDGTDQDCDGFEACYTDADGDDHGTAPPLVPSFDLTCGAAGVAPVGDDCDDADAARHPGAFDVVADGVDQDCDGFDLCYRDTDNDGYLIDASSTVPSLDGDCDDAGEEPDAIQTGDCDDGNANRFPTNADIPGNAQDEDCSGGDRCYADADNDGYVVDPMSFVESSDFDCTDPGEEPDAVQTGDCDDANPGRFPANPEVIADGIDQNCDGTELCYADADNDGYLVSVSSTVVSPDLGCGEPGEEPTNALVGDCDDNNSTRFPGNTEVVDDGADQDCDGGDRCFVDADNDGFRPGAATIVSGDLDCLDPGEGGGSDGVGDCDDGDGTTYPGAAELCGDGIDNDCDTVADCLEPSCGGDAACASACAATPLTCKVSGRSTMTIRNQSDDRRDTLKLSWTLGDPTTAAELGDPTVDTAYTLCVWDHVGGMPNLVMSMKAPPAGNCIGNPCWKSTSGGGVFRYRDRGGLPHGIQQLTIRSGPLGKPRVVVRAKGTAMPDPPMPFTQAPQITVQLVNSLGHCWGVDFVSPALTNTGARLATKETP